MKIREKSMDLRWILGGSWVDLGWILVDLGRLHAVPPPWVKIRENQRKSMKIHGSWVDLDLCSVFLSVRSVCLWQSLFQTVDLGWILDGSWVDLGGSWWILVDCGNPPWVKIRENQ